MPSFLAKVFGRKKDDRDSNSSPTGELLGGKFEAISPNISPSATQYLELQSDATRAPAPDTVDALPFFRTKSRPSSPGVKPKRLFDSLPPLSLDFDHKSAYNAYIFEDPGSMSDTVLGQRRLNPMEALVLIRACSKAIVSRGLETLGIMTPHWYSASADVQRSLISKFLRSLDLKSSVPGSPYTTNFEDEVDSTRSIHDVAAVFRWGLRHVQLDGQSFGTNDGWYRAFLDAEVANDYPPKAFSENLAHSLPTSHLDLLVSTLELFSSLAAFSESNSTSGSKLSKIFGLWLLTARQVEDKDDWRTFYARWERTGRMLEHLFLARIRDQSTDQRMPIRLLELVRKYPYTHGLSSPTTDLQLLPYPQFTTAIRPALLVRVQYEVTSKKKIPKTKINPSVLLADALSTKVEEGEFVELWAKITSAASKTGTELPLSNVLASESLRLLSFAVDKSKEEAKSPIFSPFSLAEPRYQRTFTNGAASLSPTKPITESAPLTTAGPLSPIGGDWEHFSASGFLDLDQTFPPLASTLFDIDIERTEPRNIPLPVSRKSSKRASKSLDHPRPVVFAESNGDFSPEDTKPKESQHTITASHLEVVDLDEAFVDFWSDALLDPIASDWPAFVICKFKPSLVPSLTLSTGDEKTLKWLVLEQVYSIKPRPVPSTPLPAVSAVPTTSAETSARPASPIPQTPSGRRLFNFWTMSRTPSTSSAGSQKTKKTLKTPKVGEMGELIEEEGEGQKDTSNVKLLGSKKFRSLDLPGVKKLVAKKSEKPEDEEKAKSVEVARPQVSSTSPTDVDAKATSPSTIIAASAVTAVAVGLAVEKTESDVVKDTAALEPVAESSLQSKPTDDAPKQDVAPVETEVPLADAEKPDVATTLAPVPEQDTHIVDSGTTAEPGIVSVPETAIVADEPLTKEPSKGEGETTIEEDHPEQVDQAYTTAQPGSLYPEIEETVPIPSDISDKSTFEEVSAVSEEHQASVTKEEDAWVEISAPTGKELEGESESPELEGEEEGALESVALTGVAATAVLSALPEVKTQVSEPADEHIEEDASPVNGQPEILETQVAEPDAKIGDPVDEPIEEDVSPVNGQPDVLDTLPVSDEVPAPVAEISIPDAHLAPTVIEEEAPAVEAYPEPDVEEGPSIEQVPKSATDAPAEEIPFVEDAATQEVGGGEVLVEAVPEPEDSSTPVVEDDVVIEHISPASEPSTVVDVPHISYDASEPAIQAADALSDDARPVALEEIAEQSLEVEAAVEESPVTEEHPVVESVAEEFAAETSVEPTVEETHAPEAPIEVAVEEPVSLDEAPVQELPANEAEPLAETEPESPELLTAEHATRGTVEGDSAVEVGSEESIAAGAGVQADEEPIVEELRQEAPEVEPETAVEAESVDAPIPAVADVSEESPEEPPIDAAREAFVSEEIEAPVLEIPAVAVEPEQEILSTEPTLEESSEQQPIETGTEELLEPESIPVVEESSQEETPIHAESEEVVEPLPLTEELHEEPAVEIEVSPATVPVEDAEIATEEVPTEAPQVVDESDAAAEAPLAEEVTLAEKDEEAVLDAPETIVEELSQEAPEVESEPAVEAESVAVLIPAAAIVSAESPEEPPIDTARETLTEEIETPVLEIPAVPIEPEQDVLPTEPTSEELSEQQPIETGPEELLEPESVPVAEEPRQELLEETPIQGESEEVVEPLPPTEELREEPAVETEVSEDLPAAEPNLPVEEAEIAAEDIRAEASQVVDESDAVTEAPVAEEVTLAEKDEEAVLDAPEPEVLISEVPVAGEAEEEPPLDVAEQAEGSLEPAIPSTEDAAVEGVSVVEPHAIVEATPEEESLVEAAPAATDGVVVGEGIGAVEDVPEQTAEITTEIKESDTPIPESVTASVPDVSQESTSVAEEEAIPVAAEEPVPSLSGEPDLGEVPTEAVVEASTVPDLPEVGDAPADAEETPVLADEAFNVGDSIDVIEGAPAAVEVPEQLRDAADENSSTPNLDAVGQEPLLLDTTPAEEELVAEPSSETKEIPAAVEETISEESPTSPDEPALSASDAEKTTPAEASIPFEESPPIPEEGIPLVNEVVPIPEEESPVTVEDTSAVVPEAPDAVEVLPIPVEEVTPVIAHDAEQPTATLAEEEASSSAAEANVEVISKPAAEAAAEPPDTSSAPEVSSERPIETSALDENTTSEDINQPIHSQEVELPAVEGGITDQPIVVESTADSVEKLDERTIPDSPLASTTTVDIPHAEPEPHITATQSEEADATSSLTPTSDPISENAPVEPATGNSPSPIIDQSAFVEPDTIPDSLVEPSPEQDGPKQSEHPAVEPEEPSAIPEPVEIAPTNESQPAIFDKAEEVPVPAFVEEEETSAVEEPSGEPAVGHEPTLADELSNGDGHTQFATEATDTTLVAPPDDEADSVNAKTVVEESEASEPSKVVNTVLEKEDRVATDVDAPTEAATAET